MTGQEALDNLVQSCFNPCDSDEVLNDKAIVEKSLKALEIIIKKNVDMLLIKKYDNVSDYNSAVWLSGREKLTEEEYEMIGEVLEC